MDVLLEVPEGIFYFDAASDMSGATKAKIIKVVLDSKDFVRIEFYSSNESETYAEVCCTLFLALSLLRMPFYFASSSPKILYALPPLCAWLEF